MTKEKQELAISSLDTFLRKSEEEQIKEIDEAIALNFSSKKKEPPKIELEQAQLQEFLYACVQSMSEAIVMHENPFTKMIVNNDIVKRLTSLGWKKGFVEKILVSIWDQADRMAWWDDYVREDE